MCLSCIPDIASGAAIRSLAMTLMPARLCVPRTIGRGHGTKTRISERNIAPAAGKSGKRRMQIPTVVNAKIDSYSPRFGSPGRFHIHP